jgi:hypothetical protein
MHVAKRSEGLGAQGQMAASSDERIIIHLLGQASMGLLAAPETEPKLGGRVASAAQTLP